MDKLKSILTPSHRKEEEKYGDADVRREEGVTEPSQANTAPLHTNAEAEKKEHGILRQILNPGGEKYDEVAYGETATTADPAKSVDPTALVTDAGVEKSEHGIARQLLDPSGAKYDELKYGTTAHAGSDIGVASTGSDALPIVDPNATLETNPGEKKHEHGILRQIFNPGGAKYDHVAFGSTAHVVDSPAQATTTGSHAGTTSPETHVGRDAALAGAGGAATGGVLAHEAETSHASSAPVAAPAATASAPVATPVSSTQQPVNTAPVAPYSAAGQPTQGVAVAPITASSQQAAIEPQSTSVPPPAQDSHLGRDAALAGAGGAVVGGALAAKQHEEHNTGPAPEVPAPVVASQERAHTEPEAAANPVAVHEKSAVEQELLSRIPEAQAGSSSLPATTGSSVGALGSHGSINEESHIASHPHLGAEAAAAVTGGAVAGGVLAHEHNRDVAPAVSDVENVNQPTSASHNDVESATYTYSSTPVGIGAHGGQSGEASIANLHAAPVAVDTGLVDDTPSVGIRHGQAVHDIAGAGDAEAVSSEQVNLPRANNDIEDATHVVRSFPVGSTVAPYEGYVHHTSGPHPTDIGNTLDPAGPFTSTATSTQAGSSTAGPHSSELLNKLDPRVESTPEKAAEQGQTASSSVPSESVAGAAPLPVPHQSEKHEQKLEQAREEEAEKGGDHGEKKHGFLYNILHPSHKHKDGEHSHEKHGNMTDVSAHGASDHHEGTEAAKIAAQQAYKPSVGQSQP